MVALILLHGDISILGRIVTWSNQNSYWMQDPLRIHRKRKYCFVNIAIQVPYYFSHIRKKDI